MRILQWLLGIKNKEVDKNKELENKFKELEEIIECFEERQTKPVNLPNMELLVFADLHNGLNENEKEIVKVYSKSVDAIITLGDIPIVALKDIDMSFGILGNHDSLGQLGYKDIHCRKVEVKGVTFTGIQGSFKSAEGKSILYTQEESMKLEIPKAEVLISHDTGYEIVRETFQRGLLGITNYIKENKPALHLHGHLHFNRIRQIGNTLSIGVYKCSLIKIINGEVIVEVVF